MRNEELDRLCADRELETPEIFGENAFYGMDRIIKRYAGWPQERPLKAVIPHGIVMDRNFVPRAERNIPLPAVLCYPDYRLEAYRRQTGKWVVPAASPYLYMLELFEKEADGGKGSTEKREGTLFFPAHSTHHITVEMNYERLAEKLHGLDECLHPVDVCLYWKDYNLGRAKPFLDRGFKVVSAGHMFDPEFLYRFHRLCSGYRYAGSNEIGSNLFYSVKSGCSFFFLREEVNRSAEPRRLPENFMNFDHDMAEVIFGMFNRPLPRTSPEQMKLVDGFLGTRHKKTPDELRRVLQRAEKRDRWGVWSGNYVPSFPKLARKMGKFYPGYALRRIKERTG